MERIKKLNQGINDDSLTISRPKTITPIQPHPAFPQTFALPTEPAINIYRLTCYIPLVNTSIYQLAVLN